MTVASVAPDGRRRLRAASTAAYVADGESTANASGEGDTQWAAEKAGEVSSDGWGSTAFFLPRKKAKGPTRTPPGGDEEAGAGGVNDADAACGATVGLATPGGGGGAAAVTAATSGGWPVAP